MMMMKVGVVLVLLAMAFTAATVEARFEPYNFLAEMFKDNGEPNYLIKSTTTACCDSCICTKSKPPQCRCADVREDTCHSACKHCITLAKYPPVHYVYICADTNNFCYDKCPSASAKPQIA